MARGWESKSVESQQEEAARPAASTPTRPPTPGDLERLSRQRTLQLARARAAADLSAVKREAHRAMLERTIAALDAEIAALARPAD